MGISWDNWHKSHKTGGKHKPYHKKRKYELGCPPANTKIGPLCIDTVRVRGGDKKYWALRLDVGNFSWGSECCPRKTRIIDVVYHASNNELVRTKTLVKNCLVLIDSTPYRQCYESHYARRLGRKKGEKLTPEEEEILNKKWSKKIQKKYEERKKNAKISSLLEEQFQQGKLLASDGYVSLPTKTLSNFVVLTNHLTFLGLSILIYSNTHLMFSNSCCKEQMKL
uniref:40S ribosomal protein S8 n=1 Tax=Vombatus ursinus TaxID=29139 RepID=A0A4X2KF43_VOMUR